MGDFYPFSSHSETRAATRTHSEIKQSRSRTKQEFSREAFSKQIIEASLTSLSCSSSRATTELSAIFAFGVYRNNFLKERNNDSCCIFKINHIITSTHQSLFWFHFFALFLYFLYQALARTRQSNRRCSPKKVCRDISTK